MLAFFSWSGLVLWLMVTAGWVIAAVMEGPTHWVARLLMGPMLGIGVVLQLIMAFADPPLSIRSVVDRCLGPRPKR